MDSEQQRILTRARRHVDQVRRAEERLEEAVARLEDSVAEVRMACPERSPAVSRFLNDAVDLIEQHEGLTDA